MQAPYELEQGLGVYYTVIILRKPQNPIRIIKAPALPCLRFQSEACDFGLKGFVRSASDSSMYTPATELRCRIHFAQTKSFILLEHLLKHLRFLVHRGCRLLISSRTETLRNIPCLPYDPSGQRHGRGAGNECCFSFNYRPFLPIGAIVDPFWDYLIGF